MLQMINIQIVLFGFLSTINGFDLQCPHPSQRTARIQSVCNGNSSAYTCLYDTRKKGYVEFCANRKDNYVRAGLKYVISGTFRNIRCSNRRYQPVRFWSNQSSVCMKFKSECNGFGEIVYDNRSSIYDATCRCDYTRGYAFISMPRNKCFCIPTEEDCSCYNTHCPTNTSLSPDYKCIYIGLANDKFDCQPVINRHTDGNGTHMHCLFQDNEQEHPWMRSLRTTLPVKIVCIALISGITIVVMVYLIHNCSPGRGKHNRMYGKRNNKTTESIDEKVRNVVPEFNLSNIRSANFGGTTPLMDACVAGHMLIVTDLIEKGADINISDNNGETSFTWSCLGGNIEIVNLLIEKGCDIHKPNNHGKTGLMDACGKGHLSIVNRLIEKDVDVNITDKNGETAFTWSCVYGNIEIVNSLIEKGCDIHKPNNQGKTGLMDACGEGHLSIVNRLIEKGVDVNITDKNGETAFTWSCLGGNIEIVNLLIEKGCDIHKPNNYGKTGLMNACGEGHLSIVNRLIEKGVGVNITDKNGETAFTWSCLGGNIEIVNLLIAKGCDIHKPNNDGETGLMYACCEGHLSIVNRLIEKDVDVNITDNNGRTPFIWSCDSGHRYIANVLRDKGFANN